ncbi:MAG: DUF4430 domain-containing protein [Gaiellaceae bacterium]
MIRRAAALLACLLVAACGGGGGEERGTARLWITRDRGAEVLLTTTVPAGISALEALDRVADVETRYGGRYVQEIDGLAGSLSEQRDWYYFVNGYEGDRSAAEYRLHDGDVEWWDYRSWERPGEARLVVGAFPEPFLHGYGGRRRPVAVRYAPALERGARELGRLLRASSVAPWDVPVPDGHNALRVAEGLQDGLRAGFCGGAGSAGDPVCFSLIGDPLQLAARPERVRYRYEWRP